MEWSPTNIATLLVALGSVASVLYQFYKGQAEKRQAEGEATESESQAAQSLSQAAVAMLEPYKTISSELRAQNAALARQMDEERVRRSKDEAEQHTLVKRYAERNARLEEQRRRDAEELERLRNENQAQAFQMAQLKADLNDALRRERAWELQVEDWRKTGKLKTETGALRTTPEKK